MTNFCSGWQFKFFLLILISIFTYLSFGENLYSQFSIIDDHQVIEILGKDNKLEFNELLDRIQNNEELNEITGRYRPSFQIIHLVEISIFKDNTHYYYLLRLIVFTLFVFLLSLIFINLSGILNGLLLTVILLSDIYWYDIISRIIVSEVHIIFGLIFFIPSFYYLVKFSSKKNIESKLIFTICLILFLLSGMYIAGSKENFLFIIIFPIFLIFSSELNKNRNLIMSSISIILILFCIWIIFRVLSFFLIESNLIEGYGNFSTDGINHIFSSFYNILLNEWYFFHLVSPMILFSIYLFISSKDKFLLKLSFESSFYIIVIAILLFTQIAYYSESSLPSNMRYDFPINIFQIFFYIVMIRYCLKTILFYKINVKITRILIFFVLLFFIYEKNPIQNFNQTRFYSQQHVENTIEFNEFLKNVEFNYFNNQNYSIIVHSYSVWDYELISSIYKYLYYRGNIEKIFLKLHYREEDFNSVIEKMFFKRLNAVSLGNGNWKTPYLASDWGYAELSKLNVSEECISIFIRNSNDQDLCEFNEYLKFNGR